MKQKTLFLSLMGLLALSQTADGMSILDTLENGIIALNNKSTTDKVKLGLYTAGGLIAAKFVYNWTIGLKDFIEGHKQKLTASARKMDRMLKTTDLFFIKDDATRQEKVKEYFTKNPEMINERCVWPHSPKAPSGKPLELALQIRDYRLALWLMENGAESQESGVTIDGLKQEVFNIEAYENFMDEYCLPYSGARHHVTDYGHIEHI